MFIVKLNSSSRYRGRRRFVRHFETSIIQTIEKGSLTLSNNQLYTSVVSSSVDVQVNELKSDIPKIVGENASPKTTLPMNVSKIGLSTSQPSKLTPYSHIGMETLNQSPDSKSVLPKNP